MKEEKCCFLHGIDTQKKFINFSVSADTVVLFLEYLQDVRTLFYG